MHLPNQGLPAASLVSLVRRGALQSHTSDKWIAIKLASSPRERIPSCLSRLGDADVVVVPRKLVKALYHYVRHLLPELLRRPLICDADSRAIATLPMRHWAMCARGDTTSDKLSRCWRLNGVR